MLTAENHPAIAPAVCYTGIVPPETTSDHDLDLRPELGVVRDVMRRLLRLWDREGEDIGLEEARKLAGLLFNGARTVAVLLFHQSRRPGNADDDIQNWLAEALEEMTRERGGIQKWDAG